MTLTDVRDTSYDRCIVGAFKQMTAADRSSTPARLH
jgi:hypothetical protein